MQRQLPDRRLRDFSRALAFARRIAKILCIIVAAPTIDLGTTSQAADVLVADRLTNNIYRYSETGDLLNTVVTGGSLIAQPTGLALSPDLQHLYVSSFQDRRIVRYDYDYTAGTAAGGVIFADEADNLQSPNALLFSRDGQTLYVSNLGGVGVARFTLDGTQITPNIFFGDEPEKTGHIQFSGLAYGPGESILIGGFQELPSGVGGAIGRYTPSEDTMSTLVPSTAAINGVSGLLVHESYLYVTGMFASSLRRFDAATGVLDSSFNVSGLAFPQALMAAPDGNGFLVGVLGFANGAGHIAHYNYDGTLIGDGVFASPGSGGFTEATAFISVPEPPPGDFNFDFRVDADDLDIWRQNFGATAGVTLSMGDANGNGAIDGADLLIWQRNLGFGVPTEVHAAPEPAGSALVLVGLAMLLRHHRRSSCGAAP